MELVPGIAQRCSLLYSAATSPSLPPSTSPSSTASVSFAAVRRASARSHQFFGARATGVGVRHRNPAHVGHASFPERANAIAPASTDPTSNSSMYCWSRRRALSPAKQRYCAVQFWLVRFLCGSGARMVVASRRGRGGERLRGDQGNSDPTALALCRTSSKHDDTDHCCSRRRQPTRHPVRCFPLLQ